MTDSRARFMGTGGDRNRLQSVFLIGIILASYPQFAYANAGLPMIALIWPFFFLMFVPIIYIEAFVLNKYLTKFTFFHCLKAAAKSNLFSTILGIPLTWICLLFVEFGVTYLSYTWTWLNDLSRSSLLLMAIGAAPWLPPVGREGDIPDWMIPTAFLVLLIPFFFVSAWSESFVNRKLLKTADACLVTQATWRANQASYAFLYVLVVICLAYTLLM